MALLGKNLLITDSQGIILASKSCEIDTDIELIEVSSPSTGQWRDFITGRKEWSVSTNHLVSSNSLNAQVLAIGSSVTLKMIAAPGAVKPFDGIVTSGTLITTSSASSVSGVYFYNASGVNYFVAKSGSNYYANWPNKSDYGASMTDLYEYDGTLYRFVSPGIALTTYSQYLQGTAIVKSAKVQAAVGSLAKGSFVFKGTGPLTGGSSS